MFWSGQGLNVCHVSVTAPTPFNATPQLPADVAYVARLMLFDIQGAERVP